MKSKRDETKAAAKSGAPVVVSRQQLASILGVHPDRISEYTAAGLPVLHRGGVGGGLERRSQYDAVACAQWVRAHRPGTFDAQKEKARRDRSTAELNELRLAERKKELVSAKDVELVWSRHVVEARTQLLGVVSRFKGRRPGATQEDLRALDVLIRESLEALADGTAVKET